MIWTEMEEMFIKGEYTKKEIELFKTIYDIAFMEGKSASIKDLEEIFTQQMKGGIVKNGS